MGGREEDFAEIRPALRCVFNGSDPVTLVLHTRSSQPHHSVRMKHTRYLPGTFPFDIWQRR